MTHPPMTHFGALRAAIKQAVMDVRERTRWRSRSPISVTINLVANAQLAAGGTAAMSYLPDDVIATAEIAGSNYINVGTLLPFFKRRAAGNRAQTARKRQDVGARPGCCGHWRNTHVHS